MMSYLSEALCRIGTRSKTMYDMFYLHSATQTHIIALGNNQDNLEAPALEDQYLVILTQELPIMEGINQIST